MVHHKIQKKKRNKLKSVDPFNPNARIIQESKMKGKNLEPKTDDQPITNKLKELMQSSNSNNSKPNKKRPRTRDLLRREAERAGFKMKQHEGIRGLLRRMGSSIHSDISDIRLLAKHNIAGRDFREIDKDYKKMDEENARKKQAKQEMRKKILEKKSKLLTKPVESQQANDIAKESTHNVRLRLKHELKQKEENDELILNAKEVIPFGSRVDAPPDFRKKNLFQKGTKDGLTTEREKSSVNNKKITSNQMELEKERSRVIEAYRTWKKNKSSPML